MLRMKVFAFSGKLCVTSCAFLCPNICLPVRSTEWIPYFTLLECTAFALPVKFSSSQPTHFLSYTFLILFPIPLSGNELCGTWLPVGLTDNKIPCIYIYVCLMGPNYHLFVYKIYIKHAVAMWNKGWNVMVL